MAEAQTEAPNLNLGRSNRRLRTAVEFSRKQLIPFRQDRIHGIRQMLGKHYGDNASEKQIVVGLLHLMVSTYKRWLVARNPKVLVSTVHLKLRAQADLWAMAINHLIEEISLEKTLQGVALDAQFGPGIIKTGIDIQGIVEVAQGEFHDIGQPYADHVDLDDWVHDTAAWTLEQCQFMGNKYRVPLKYVRESGLFKGGDKLQPSRKEPHDEEGQERAEALSRGEQIEDSDEFMHYVEMWDIYLPPENVMLTFPVDSPANGEDAWTTPLREVEWEGPERGPYHMINFEMVPRQIMGLPPTSIVMDLHELANVIWRKLKNQGERQKTVGVYQSGDNEDAERLRKASDGDFIGVKSPGPITEMRLGGPDQVNLALGIAVKDMFSWFAGNLDLLGGLGPMSETLGQDKILMQQSSQKLQDMQDTMYAFTREVLQDLAWYLSTDPLIDIPDVKRIEGTDIEIEVRFTNDDREDDFNQYNFDIEPYSMQPSTPTSRLQMVDKVMQEIVMPALPILQQQGITVKFGELLKLYAKYGNVPELAEFLDFGDPVMDAQNQPVQPGGSSQPMRQASHTVRENVRRNVPASTGPGMDTRMIQSLLAGTQEN